MRALKIDPKRDPKEHSIKIWIFNGFGKVLGALGESFGRIWDRFWEGLGRVLGGCGCFWVTLGDS
jgi:hypothetical protein